MIKLTTLYARTSKKGERYLSGRIGDLNVLIFKEDEQTDDGNDKYRVMLASRERKDEGQAQDRGNWQSPPSGKRY